MPSFFKGFAKGFLETSSDTMYRNQEQKRDIDKKRAEILDTLNANKELARVQSQLDIQKEITKKEYETQRAREAISALFGQNVQNYQQKKQEQEQFAPMQQPFAVDLSANNMEIPDEITDAAPEVAPSGPNLMSSESIVQTNDPVEPVRPANDFSEDERRYISAATSVDDLNERTKVVYAERLKDNTKRKVTSGMKEQAQKTAEALGVPLDEMNPIWDMTDEQRLKVESEAKKVFRSKDSIEDLKNSRDNVLEAQKLVKLVGKKGKLSTGPWRILPGTTLLDKDAQEFEAIISKLAPKQRVAGSGASSDADVKIFHKALPTLLRFNESNTTVAQFLLMNAQRQVDYNSFRESYFRANRNIDGVDSAWDDYVQSNPILSEDPKDGLKAVAPMTWQEYFSSGGQAPEGTVPVEDTSTTTEAPTNAPIRKRWNPETNSFDVVE
jgi:hypothetical protein